MKSMDFVWGESNVQTFIQQRNVKMWIAVLWIVGKDTHSNADFLQLRKAADLEVLVACKFDHQKPMYFQTELDELKSNQEKMRTELHELKSNQKNMTQHMKIQDEKVKLHKERISSLEKNLLDFVNGPTGGWAWKGLPKGSFNSRIPDTLHIVTSFIWNKQINE